MLPLGIYQCSQKEDWAKQYGLYLCKPVERKAHQAHARSSAANRKFLCICQHAEETKSGDREICRECSITNKGSRGHHPTDSNFSPKTKRAISTVMFSGRSQHYTLLYSEAGK